MSSAAPNPVNIRLGERARLRRDLLGLSREAVGKAIGVSGRRIADIERGVARVDVALLVGLAGALDTATTYFLDESADGDGLGAASADAEFTGYFAKLTGKQRTTLLHLAKSMAEVPPKRAGARQR